jgi:huntingtin
VLIPFVHNHTETDFTSLIDVASQGLERLVVTGTVGGKVAEQVMKLAVERIRHTNPTVAVPALQLLLSCMYTGRK